MGKTTLIRHFARTTNIPDDLSIPSGRTGAPPARQSTAEEETRRLLQALQASGGNRSEAARRLGIDRTTLYRRLRRLGLEDRRE
jgi:transcriptional regulator of acetoin/glycerol metabolism